MNISAIWIRRPVMTTLVMVGMLFFGLISYESLPTDFLPNVDFPTITVSAGLPGADPETMAATVATPLEKQFTTINGISSMTSKSINSSTTITIQFDLSRNIDGASGDVNAMINAARGTLPTNMPSPPTYQKVNPADSPIIWFGLTSSSMPLYKVNEYAVNLLQNRFSMLEGVSQVLIYGAQQFAVRVRVDPHKLTTLGVGLNDVQNALQNGNVNLPNGTIDGPYITYQIQSNGQLYTAAQYNTLIIAYKDGKPIRIQDVGHAEDSVLVDKSAAWFITPDRSARGVFVAVMRQPGSNTVKVAQAIKNTLPSIEATLPKALEMRLLYDQSIFIKQSLDDVQFTLLITIGLVVLVIFIFLRSLTATIIPSIAVPLSLIMTFAVMYMLNYTLNTLSLLALVLAVGFVVDDAIVMLENIVRRMEMGESAREAALKGSKEIGFTILSMTLSLFVVFIPLIFMGGIVGRLFRQFAVSVGAAILISGFVSLTLTPMLCSRWIRHSSQTRHGWLYNLSEKGFQLWLKLYQITLRWALRHRWVMLLLTVIIMASSVHLYTLVPKGFIPSEDRNNFMVYTQADASVSFTNMAKHMEALNKLINVIPDVYGMASVVGLRGQQNVGLLVPFLNNKPPRQKTPEELIQMARPFLGSVAGIWAFPVNPPPITIGGQQTNALYQFTMLAFTLDDVAKYSYIMTNKIKQIQGVIDVNSDLQYNAPKVNIQVDRDKASALGLTLNQIQSAFYAAYGEQQVSTIYGTMDQYKVILELLPEYKTKPEALDLLYVKSASTGSLVPVNTVARMNQIRGPIAVNHTEMFPSVTISFNLKPGFSIGDVVPQIEAIAKETLPVTVSHMFQGSAQAFSDSFATMGFLLFITVMIIYLVLGILYESFIHPITILTSLPLAGFGALLSLLIFRMELDMYSFVGVIMLVGLVKKNGIMMVDFALEEERLKGLNSEESIFQACIIRFRPIMMTTMAAIFGTLPIALGFGAGGASRAPLGVAVVGGLIFSQMLTLYITPVFYVYMDRLNRFLNREKDETKAVAAEEPEAI